MFVRRLSASKPGREAKWAAVLPGLDQIAHSPAQTTTSVVAIISAKK